MALPTWATLLGNTYQHVSRVLELQKSVLGMKEGVESFRTFLTSASLLSEELAGVVNICATVAALYSFSDFAGDIIVIIVER
jgi:hypothetical protein